MTQLLEFVDRREALKFQEKMYEAGLTEDEINLEEATHIATLMAKDPECGLRALEVAAQLCNASPSSRLS